MKTAGFILIAAAFFLTACRRPPKTDLRKLVPRETLVYLESNDVAATLEALSANPAFQTLAENRVDYSALKNIQAALAVTGFETSEENAALHLKPRFVAVAETHAWRWQAVSIVENQLDSFVKKNYGATAKLEKIERDGGEFFTWTAADQRRVFAFAQNSLIYFGSDAAAIEKCLAVKKGAAEGLARNDFFNRAEAENNLAFGYVSSDGIKQIAALAGISVAVNSSEEPDERDFIARIVPEILQHTTEEIVWTANRTTRGIEDKYSVNLTPETAFAIKEIFDSNAAAPVNFINFLPPDVFSATRYNLKNPLISWRRSNLLTAKNADVLSGKLLLEFSGKLLEPYGILDAETFLSAVDSPLVTAQFDAENTKSVTIAAVKETDKLKNSISKEINFKKPPEKLSNAEIWFSDDKNLAAAFIENKLVLGDGESVLKCLRTGQNTVKNPAFQRFAESRSVAATFGTDAEAAGKIVKVPAQVKDDHRKSATFYTTETRLTENGFERVTVSDFGLIGAILGKLN